MKSKVLSGLGAAGKAITEPNPLSDGGLSALLIKRRFNAGGVALMLGGMGAVNIGNQGLQARNRNKLGRISYQPGLARMTKPYNTGVVPAMHRASQGNQAVFADMAEEIVKPSGIVGQVENYGATPELISALYHMGGR